MAGRWLASSRIPAFCRLAASSIFDRSEAHSIATAKKVVRRMSAACFCACPNIGSVLGNMRASRNNGRPLFRQ